MQLNSLLQTAQPILKLTYFNNSVFDYVISILIFLFLVVLVKLIRGVVLAYVKKLTRMTESTLDDFLIENIEKSLVPVLYFGAFFLGTTHLSLSPAITKGINALGSIIITLYGIKFLVSTITHALEVFWLKTDRDATKEKSLKGLLTILKVIIWGAGLVFLLDNLGFKISAVIAGLGIGGVAIALAAQTVLGDLFSYISILFDRPFEAGDFIIIDDKLGTVEHIGVKTTRISSLSGEQLVFSNSDLTSSRIRNFKRMEQRRVLFKFGVIYQTRHEQLKEIPKIVKSIIESIKDTIFDRAHFQSYGDSSLDFEVVYYVKGNDYNKYMDIQQEINLKLFEEFEKRKIDFAYPTRTLYVNKTV